MYYLYRHIRLDKNIPFYIGVGTIQKIRNKYFYYSRASDKSNRNNLWNKIVLKTDYKIEIVLESDNYKLILEKEKEFIKLYGRLDIKSGSLANLTSGGEGASNINKTSIENRTNKLKGKKRTEEFKLRLSNIKKGSKNSMFGKKHSEETKTTMSIKAKGNTNRLGTTQKEETRRKISESKIGNKHYKSKLVLDLQLGIYYETLTEAAESINTNRGYLSNMLNNKSKNYTNMIFV